MSLAVCFLRVYFAFFLLPLSTQTLAASIYVVACSIYLWIILKRLWGPVYVMGFGCFAAPEHYRVPYASFIEHCSLLKDKFDEGSVQFQEKVLAKAGMSQMTALPLGFHYLPPRITLTNERIECETVLFGAIDELFSFVNVKMEDIGVLVTNCSAFSPTPSMSSMIINKYKLPVDVKSFTLSGMGCSVGPLALDLAKRVLQCNPNKYALVLSTENLTRNLYFGNQRSMLVTNCLFRMGGSAVLLSNKWSDRKMAKYKVLYTARSHMGAIDSCYRSVYQEEDSEGIIGVGLSKDLMKSAALALQHNMKILGPKVLPLSELLLYALHLMKTKFSHKKDSDLKPYIPNFKLAYDHICIHAGGTAVIRAMEEALDIPFEHSEPSHMTLYRFGNLSSASIWYELAYEESKGRVKKGHKIWQIGLGSGFKCCSAFLLAMKTIDISTSSQCWASCISELPVEVPIGRRSH